MTDARAGFGTDEIILTLNLLVVATLIFFASRKGVRAMLDNRSQAFAKRLADAAAELSRLNSALAAARDELRQIEDVRRKILEETRQEAEKSARQLVDEAQRNAKSILTDAQLAAENEVRLASQRFKERLVREALGRVESLTRDKFKSEAHERLMGHFFLEQPNNGH